MGLFDATAASGWCRRHGYLSVALSTKENGDISLCFLPLLAKGDLSRSVVLLDDQATSPSVAVVEEGPRRSPYLSLSSPRRNRCELYLRRIEGKDLLKSCEREEFDSVRKMRFWKERLAIEMCVVGRGIIA
ncbi:hypothetical protein Bca101_087307 [Brassica carinata]